MFFINEYFLNIETFMLKPLNTKYICFYKFKSSRMFRFVKCIQSIEGTKHQEIQGNTDDNVIADKETIPTD